LSTTDATRALGSTVPKATAAPDFLTIAFISTMQSAYAEKKTQSCDKRKKTILQKYWKK
jgi:hypothetical protein